MRTLVDIPDDDLVKLDAIASRDKRSRAAEIREAIRLHILRKSDSDWLARGYGYWKDRDDISDGLAFQRSAREDREID